MKIIIACLILFVLLLSHVIVVGATYVQWTHYVDQVTFGTETYSIIGGKGIASTEYESADKIPIYIYTIYSAYEISTGNNYTVMERLDENGSILNQTLIKSQEYNVLYGEEGEVSTYNKFAVFVLWGRDASGDDDGIVMLTDLNMTNIKYYVFDGINQTFNSTRFADVFIASNNHVFVVGYVYDSANNVYDGLLLDLYYNGTDLLLESVTPYIYTDPDGYSNLLFFTDVLIGPDGYLYIVGYIPSYSGTYLYDYKGIIMKVDPFTYDIIKTVTFRLWNQYGYMGYRTFSGSLFGYDTYLYTTFNSLSDTLSGTSFTRAALIAKLDTDLNIIWQKKWNDIDYNNILFDIAVTSENITGVGGTDNNYGNTSFQGYNAAIIVLSPDDGSPKHGFIIGGTGDEFFKDPSIDYEGYLCTIGDTTSQLSEIGDMRITGDDISISQYIRPSNADKTDLKPLNNTREERLFPSFLEPKLGGGKSVPVVGTPGLHKASIKEGIHLRDVSDVIKTYPSIKEGRGGIVGLQTPSRPALMVKLSEPAGTVSTPPPPVPESNILVLLGLLVGLSTAVGMGYLSRHVS